MTLRYVCFRGNSGHWGMSALPPKADMPDAFALLIVNPADIATPRFVVPLERHTGLIVDTARVTTQRQCRLRLYWRGG